MDNFDSIVAWLASGAGAVIVASWFASWLLDDWAWWKNLPEKAKKLLILGVALVLGIGGTILVQYPEFHAAIKPYLDTVVLVISAWLSTQLAHKVDKKTE